MPLRVMTMREILAARAEGRQAIPVPITLLLDEGRPVASPERKEAE
jgi:hypothetical protein